MHEETHRVTIETFPDGSQFVVESILATYDRYGYPIWHTTMQIINTPEEA